MCETNICEITLGDTESMGEDMDINSAWGDFCESGWVGDTIPNKNVLDKLPKSSDIYISTKTRIAYLNQKIDLSNIFWRLPILEYHKQTTGIVKKQMKFNSTNEVELNHILNKIPKDVYTEQFIITKINNPDGRIKFKDVRKISLGLCKKDIISYRGKQKGAFYNCFVLLLRILHEGIFKEVHIKVFNTGKLEIPGMRDDNILYIALELLVDILNKNISMDKEFNYIKHKCDTVLINSNFKCGFYLNREKLYNILKNKYRINCSYDSCSYPGIQCEFYYDPIIKHQTGQQPIDKSKKITKVSFMIFRTGSALIVGKCTENILYDIYKFLCKLLADEYPNISCGINIESLTGDNISKKKSNKRKVVISI